MAVALSLGERGLGKVWPNPAVGCVLVKDGRVVGRGWTQSGGRPHAEIVALAQAAEDARGATAYVTLEPCNHTGKSGPCSEALIASGIARIVIACADPHLAASGGAKRLEQAGIRVEMGILKEEALESHLGFLSVVERARPMLTLKLAPSLDGRIATATGASQWITGALARKNVHVMRAKHDAVLIGAGTARTDNPSLTVRGIGEIHQPVRVVLSKRLDLPKSGVLCETAGTVPLWIIHAPDAPHDRQNFWRNAGAKLLPVGLSGSGDLCLSEALQSLAQCGLTRVLCEGGGMLAASLLVGDFVDRLVVYSGGLAIGAEGTPSVGAMGIANLPEAPRFSLLRVEAISPDTVTHWRRISN